MDNINMKTIKFIEVKRTAFLKDKKVYSRKKKHKNTN